MGDLFSDFAEVFDSEDAPEDKPACGAKDRNATCIRTLEHPGWHRSKTGVCWPPKKEEKR